MKYIEWRKEVKERLKAKKGCWSVAKTGRHYADDDFWEIIAPDFTIGDEFGGLLDEATARLIINAPDDLEYALELIDQYRTALEDIAKQMTMEEYESETNEEYDLENAAEAYEIAILVARDALADSIE